MAATPTYLVFATGLLLAACGSTGTRRCETAHHEAPRAAKCRPRTVPVDELAALGKVAFLMYLPPESGEEIAASAVVFWEFESGARVAFSPGDFVAEPGNPDTGHIQILNVVRHASEPRSFGIHYAVYGDTNEPPIRRGVYEYDAQLPARHDDRPR